MIRVDRLSLSQPVCFNKGIAGILRGKIVPLDYLQGEKIYFVHLLLAHKTSPACLFVCLQVFSMVCPCSITYVRLLHILLPKLSCTHTATQLATLSVAIRSRHLPKSRYSLMTKKAQQTKKDKEKKRKREGKEEEGKTHYNYSTTKFQPGNQPIFLLCIHPALFCQLASQPALSSSRLLQQLLPYVK